MESLYQHLNTLNINPLSPGPSAFFHLLLLQVSSDSIEYPRKLSLVVLLLPYFYRAPSFVYEHKLKVNQEYLFLITS
ncbi:hypothetical protein AQUCO_00901015v1 [Aquilegia coerulea]|uniref:Uncharacterized protein n=1 Tax=Aquilegia coerulea TaxID=218851 RepID=A0A2G5EGY3_AQUCA|nr:hypothetical protein AQUCO_00901015v1 [Aquilegia coerulea]